MFLQIRKLDPSRKSHIKLSNEQFKNLFVLLDESGEGQISREEFLKIFQVYQLFKYECDKSVFGMTDVKVESELGGQRTLKERVRAVIDSTWYELIVNILSMVNLTALAVRDFQGGSYYEFIFTWCYC